jgi:hypothetical protein
MLAVVMAASESAVARPFKARFLKLLWLNFVSSEGLVRGVLGIG